MWLTSLTVEQRRVLLDLAHTVIVSDGLVDPNEEFMLDSFKREMELGAKVQPSYLELDGIDKVFDTRRTRTVALLNLLKLSYVDGAFEIEEECVLKEISRAFGVSDADFLLLDNWVRRLVALEQEARGLM